MINLFASVGHIHVALRSQYHVSNENKVKWGHGFTITFLYVSAQNILSAPSCISIGVHHLKFPYGFAFFGMIKTVCKQWECRKLEKTFAVQNDLLDF